MDPIEPAAIIGGLVTAITGLASFVVYLIKSVLADKDKQIDELRADRDEWKETALSALRTGEILAETKTGRHPTGTIRRGRSD